MIRANRKILYKIIRAYCKDQEDRQDLEQEIIIQLWKSFKTYNDQFKLSTWIYRIALNVAISHYRKDIKRKEKTIPLSDTLFQAVDDQEATEALDNNLELLHAFINQLDRLNKALMILYLEGNSYKDIAEILGISESNVGTKINRIKKMLKEKFSTQQTHPRWN
ncbi:MAG: sigma-70 family RNA polymerase sigma factor [Ferruginibacter sp.]|nr:sigma-70 family RNA polymerase sigma factor [Cytophagales bacterium]